jgi:hypothetical protein
MTADSLRTLTPTDMAADRFCPMARIARPVSVKRKKGPQCRDQDQRQDSRNNLDVGNDYAAEHGRRVGVSDRDDPRVGRPGYRSEIFKQHHQAEHGHQALRLRSKLDAGNQQTIDKRAEDEENRKRQKEGNDGINSQPPEQLEREERAQHDERAMRDIDDPHDAQHQTEPHAGNGVDQSKEDPVGEDGEKLIQLIPRSPCPIF